MFCLNFIINKKFIEILLEIFPRECLTRLSLTRFKAVGLSRGFLIFSLGIERVTEKC